MDGITSTRSAFDEHVRAVSGGDTARIAAGYAAEALLVLPGGAVIEGPSNITSWFAERGDFFASMSLRPERIEIRPGLAALGWWGEVGADRFEGRDEFDVDDRGLITEQRVVRVSRTTRPPVGLRVEIEPPLARLVLDRDEKRNSVSQPMLAAMTAFVNEVRDTSSLRALVLSGSGRAFCAGEDVGGFEFPDVETCVRFLDGPFDFFTAVETLPKPVVVAVHGAALGFGSEVLLVADAVYADPGSTLGFAEIDHGAVPSVLVTRGLDVVFRRRVLDLALTGRRISASEAYEMRLVHELTDDPVGAAEAAARQMAEWSPAAVALVKGYLGRGAGDDHDRAREFMPAVLMQVEPAL